MNFIELPKRNLRKIEADGGQQQFTDPRLKEKYNMIALDTRCHGFTFGADVESFTLEVEALILCSPGRLQEPPAVAQHMYNDWFCPIAANKGLNLSGEVPPEGLQVRNDYLFGREVRYPAKQAMFQAAFQSRYGPGHSAHDLRHMVLWFQRKAIPAELRAQITVPILIIRGGSDTTTPLSADQEWQTGFTSARNGADLRIIQSAPHLLSATHGSIVNRWIWDTLTASLYGR
ncbi:beta-ketoadipate enol-lactone hydrolase [Pseudohyphozyma bogoriensis]|nr:beta-ketoadipate enol-lactone hydrolase [Pseudohyphozyma bogoriensis]